MPSLEDEKLTYLNWGWTWTSGDEPNYGVDSNYSVTNPDIHGDTEGDDLWSNLNMFRRTGELGYKDRMNMWATYFKNNYRSCIQNTQSYSYCFDRDQMDLDHIYGWGLIGLYEYNGDSAALSAAEALAGDSETKFLNQKIR